MPFLLYVIVILLFVEKDPTAASYELVMVLKCSPLYSDWIMVTQAVYHGSLCYFAIAIIYLVIDSKMI